jgi:hypothetical protein
MREPAAWIEYGPMVGIDAATPRHTCRSDRTAAGRIPRQSFVGSRRAVLATMMERYHSPSSAIDAPAGCDGRSRNLLTKTNVGRGNQGDLAMPRELIEPHKGDKRYVRRNKGKFSSRQSSVGRSLSADRRSKARTIVKKGEGDRGDQRRS